MLVIEIRAARLADDAELLRIDRATWSPDVSPAPEPSADGAFFGDRVRPEEVIVAVSQRATAGWAKLGQPIPLAAHRHVLELQGLAVDPAVHRRGIARALLEAAVAHARGLGARKVSLRVLGPNRAAQRLYESCGFAVEGVLRAEFLLAGRYVDDILMARRLD